MLIDCIYYLSAIGQVELPYHIREVQSNDSIYGNNEKYNEAIVEKVEIIMGRYEELYNENILKYPLISIELLETILVIGNVEKVYFLYFCYFAIILRYYFLYLFFIMERYEELYYENLLKYLILKYIYKY